MTAEELLKIKMPEKLFSPSLIEAQRQYRELVKKWHPDKNTSADAQTVFTHVRNLYNLARTKIACNYWGYAGAITIREGHKSSTVKYQSAQSFELGRVLITPEEVIYIISDSHRALAENILYARSWFVYASNLMAEEVKRYLPTELQHSAGVYRIKKDKSFLSLRSVLNYYGGSMEPRSVAWIMSTLYNLSCYLEYAGIVHHDISVDTYFINPEKHSGALLGGWWYAARRGDRIKVVPKRTYELLPWKVRTNKIASRATDAELILAVGRELLGAGNGNKMRADTPKAMVEWLTAVGGTGAIENYRKWALVLEESFGPRRFTPMNLTSEMLY